MIDAAGRLRDLHRTPPIFVIPNAWDAASARLFEAEGFPAIATTSAGVAASLGYPDGGVVTWPVDFTITPAAESPSQNLALAGVVGLVGVLVVVAVAMLALRRRPSST